MYLLLLGSTVRMKKDNNNIFINTDLIYDLAFQNTCIFPGNNACAACHWKALYNVLKYTIRNKQYLS